MAERLRDSEVDRLRQIVGMGSQPAAREQETPEDDIPEDKGVPEQGTSSRDTRLFVKIDEHEAVSKELAEARRDIKAIADTIELLGKAEKLKADAVARMEENLEVLDEKIKFIEPKLQAPEGLAEGEAPGEISDYSDDTLGDLRGELERLKGELKGQ